MSVAPPPRPSVRRSSSVAPERTVTLPAKRADVNASTKVVRAAPQRGASTEPRRQGVQIRDVFSIKIIIVRTLSAAPSVKAPAPNISKSTRGQPSQPAAQSEPSDFRKFLAQARADRKTSPPHAVPTIAESEVEAVLNTTQTLASPSVSVSASVQECHAPSDMDENTRRISMSASAPHHEDEAPADHSVTRSISTPDSSSARTQVIPKPPQSPFDVGSPTMVLNKAAPRVSLSKLHESSM